MHALVLSLLFELASCKYLKASGVCITNFLLYSGGHINLPPFIPLYSLFIGTYQIHAKMLWPPAFGMDTGMDTVYPHATKESDDKGAEGG